MLKFYTYSQLLELAISIPKIKNMGIARRDMPQIKKKDYPDFIKYLSKNGISLKSDRYFADELKPIQKDFSKKGAADALRKKTEKRIIISKDLYIIDGHHRWLAYYNYKPDTGLAVLKANVNAAELFDIVSKYPKVHKKDIY